MMYYNNNNNNKILFVLFLYVHYITFKNGSPIRAFSLLMEKKFQDRITSRNRAIDGVETPVWTCCNAETFNTVFCRIERETTEQNGRYRFLLRLLLRGTTFDCTFPPILFRLVFVAFYGL